MLVTGNGHCNYANLGSTIGKYHNDEFANNLLKQFTPQDIVQTFDRWGVHPEIVNDLVYPVSNSAASVALILKKQLHKLDVTILCEQLMLDYQKR